MALFKPSLSFASGTLTMSVSAARAAVGAIVNPEEGASAGTTVNTNRAMKMAADDCGTRRLSGDIDDPFYRGGGSARTPVAPPVRGASLVRVGPAKCLFRYRDETDPLPR